MASLYLLLSFGIDTSPKGIMIYASAILVYLVPSLAGPPLLNPRIQPLQYVVAEQKNNHCTMYTLLLFLLSWHHSIADFAVTITVSNINEEFDAILKLGKEKGFFFWVAMIDIPSFLFHFLVFLFRFIFLSFLFFFFFGRVCILSVHSTKSKQ